MPPLGDSSYCDKCGAVYRTGSAHACGSRSSAHAALDLDVIASRAESAPGVAYEAFVNRLWIGFSAPGDDEHDGQWHDSGRWVEITEQSWHRGSEDPGPELWNLFANARADVLALVAEVRWLRSALAGALTSPPVREAA